MQCATWFHLCSAQNSGQMDGSAASEVSPCGHRSKTTDTISGAVTSSSCKTFLLSLVLLQSGVIPWCVGSAHTVTEHLLQFHSSRWPVPAMSQSECRPTFSELPLWWPPLLFQNGTAPRDLALLHTPQHKQQKPKYDLPPHCTPAGGEQAIFLCLSFSKCLVRGTKKFFHKH